MTMTIGISMMMAPCCSNAMLFCRIRGHVVIDSQSLHQCKTSSLILTLHLLKFYFCFSAETCEHYDEYYITGIVGQGEALEEYIHLHNF